DSRGQLWIGTFGNGLIHYDPSNGQYRRYRHGSGARDISYHQISCLMEDRFGQIWVGTNGGGVNIIGKDRNSVSQISRNHQSLAPTLPVNNYIRDIEEDADGNIWLASYGAG